MKSFQFLALVGAVFGCVHAQQYPAGALGSYSSQTSTTPRPLPPAQVHYVAIGDDLAGDYKFGYDTGKNDGGQSFREESRLPDGTVKGAYGYIDAEGKQRIVKYTAGIEGFKIESDEAAPGSGAAPAQAPARSYQPRPAAAPAPVQYQPRPAPAPVQYHPPQAQPAQQLGGYAPVAPQPRYSPPAAPQPQPIAQPSPAQYQAPSPLPNYNAALQAQLAAVQASGARSVAAPVQAAPAYRPQPVASAVPSYSATLAQRQPTLAQARPSHLGSVPRSASPSLASYGSQFGNAVEQPQESTTWGPPVINKELLSYNIGVGRR